MTNNSFLARRRDSLTQQRLTEPHTGSKDSATAVAGQSTRTAVAAAGSAAVAGTVAGTVAAAGTVVVVAAAAAEPSGPSCGSDRAPCTQGDS